MLLFVPDFHLHEELLKEIDAADALIDVLLGNAVESSLDIHQSALNRERLGGIIKAALDDKPLSALIDKTGNADPFNDFKVKYTDIKQQCSAEEDVNQAFYSGM